MTLMLEYVICSNMYGKSHPRTRQAVVACALSRSESLPGSRWASWQNGKRLREKCKKQTALIMLLLRHLKLS